MDAVWIAMDTDYNSASELFAAKAFILVRFLDIIMCDACWLATEKRLWVVAAMIATFASSCWVHIHDGALHRDCDEEAPLPYRTCVGFVILAAWTIRRFDHDSRMQMWTDQAGGQGHHVPRHQPRDPCNLCASVDAHLLQLVYVLLHIQ